MTARRMRAVSILFFSGLVFCAACNVVARSYDATLNTGCFEPSTLFSDSLSVVDDFL